MYGVWTWSCIESYKCYKKNLISCPNGYKLSEPTCQIWDGEKVTFDCNAKTYTGKSIKDLPNTIYVNGCYTSNGDQYTQLKRNFYNLSILHCIPKTLSSFLI